MVADTRDRELQSRYSDWARNYDAMRFGNISGQLYVQLQQEFFREIADSRTMNILDVGTGTGRLALGFAETGRAVTGIDISSEMIHVACEEADMEGIKNVQFILGNARHLPFPQESFDMVVSARFLHLFSSQDVRVLLVEMIRVLKPGGILAVEIRSFLVALGLTVTKLLRNGVVSKYPRLLPHEFPQLFNGVTITDQVGFMLPFSGRFARFLGKETIVKLNRRLLGKPPLCYLGHTVVIVGRKMDYEHALGA
jgi:ubiquinone/menaquinone biosynthesis C-methylase UbiE